MTRTMSAIRGDVGWSLVILDSGFWESGDSISAANMRLGMGSERSLRIAKSITGGR